MDTTISISLNKQLETFVTELVKCGDYGSVNEVIEAALGLLVEYEIEQQEKFELLQESVDEAKASIKRGQGMDSKQFVRDLLARKCK